MLIKFYREKYLKIRLQKSSNCDFDFHYRSFDSYKIQKYFLCKGLSRRCSGCGADLLFYHIFLPDRIKKTAFRNLYIFLRNRVFTVFQICRITRISKQPDFDDRFGKLFQLDRYSLLLCWMRYSAFNSEN